MSKPKSWCSDCGQPTKAPAPAQVDRVAVLKQRRDALEKELNEVLNELARLGAL